MKEKFNEILRLFLILLFVYTATNKIMTQATFAEGLERFPFLKDYASFIAFAVPIIEFAIAFLLLVPRTSKYGIVTSLILMVLFTCYLAYSILSGYNLPCSCGGVISKMSWTQHLYFNVTIIAMISFSVLFQRGKKAL